jgi:hypothetical protein
MQRLFLLLKIIFGALFYDGSYSGNEGILTEIFAWFGKSAE